MVFLIPIPCTQDRIPILIHCARVVVALEESRGWTILHKLILFQQRAVFPGVYLVLSCSQLNKEQGFSLQV